MGRQLSFPETETGDPETPESLTKGPLSFRVLHACFQPVTPLSSSAVSPVKSVTPVKTADGFGSLRTCAESLGIQTRSV